MKERGGEKESGVSGPRFPKGTLWGPPTSRDKTTKGKGGGGGPGGGKGDPTGWGGGGKEQQESP